MLDLFTAAVRSGADDGQAAAFSGETLARLDGVLGALPTTSEGVIGVEHVYEELAKSHAYLRDAAEALGRTVALLLGAHASFPFAEEVPLTRDALVRAVGMLTQSSDAMFAQEAECGGKTAVRARSKTARMEFLFSVLARPETGVGVPTRGDVVDVLCRVRYPAPASPTYSQRRPITELEPIAGRLLPEGLPERDGLRVEMVELRPLADLCNAMKEDGGVKAEEMLEGKKELEKEEFIQWAKAVS